MRSRKVQRVSNGTFTVSLPKEWAERNDVDAGTTVEMHPHEDGVLAIQTEERDADPTATVTITPATSPSETERRLRAVYVAGAKEAQVSAPGGLDDDQREAVRAAARRTPGVTVTEESETRAAVRTVLDSEEVSVRQSVHHLRFLATSSHREATAALVSADGAAPADDRDRAAAMAAMVERCFVRSLSRLDEVDRLGERRPALYRFARTADELARVAACADRIASVAEAVDGPLGVPSAAAVEATGADAREAVETAVEAVFDVDPEAIRTAVVIRDDVRSETDDLRRRLFEASDGDYRTARALAAIERTADRAASIAAIARRRLVRRDTGTPPQSVGGDAGPDSASASDRS